MAVFLKELTQLNAVSSDEGAVRSFLIEKLQPLCDSVQVDAMGNVLAIKQSKQAGAKSVMLAAHMDEVGLMAAAIQPDGLIRFLPVGTLDPAVCVSKRVTIVKNGISGVIGSKAVHLQEPGERTRPVEFKQMYVNIGASTKEEAQKYVTPGDMIAFDSPYVEFGDGCVKAKALDDRVGCAVLLKLLEGEYPVTIKAAFTVQEEVGMRGAIVAGYTLDADMAITLEGTSANDTADVKAHQTVCCLCKGPAISFRDRSHIGHAGLRQALVAIAQNNNIPYQFKSAIAGGTDSASIQVARGSRPVITMAVPCRYIHSPSSVMKLVDADSTHDLVSAFLRGGAII